MGLAYRVIACLDVSGGRVVKGVNFEGLIDAGDPVALAKNYNQQGIDELVFLDVSATIEERATTIETVSKTAREVFIPLTVGGGVRTDKDVDLLLRSGADKVSINTAAVKNPKLLKELSEKYGSQCIVISVDAKRTKNTACLSGFVVTTHGGKEETNIDLLDWVRTCIDYGVGEILLNSIDADGTKAGFDLEMIQLVSKISTVPIIASGGAGKVEDFSQAIENGANAVLAASVFHFGHISVKEVKESLLNHNLEVRL